MKLTQLIQNIAKTNPSQGDADPEITSVHYSSLDVRPGGLFVAVRGHAADGHDFIDDAIGRGAVAVLTDREITATVPVAICANSRKAMAEIAARFYGNPSEKLYVIGITGTNGKTTTTYLLEGMLRAAGAEPGVIGTINRRFAGKVEESPTTTPESVDLQRMLKEMVDAGCTHVIMEVSSHAIDLSRVHGVSFDMGLFTNLSQDHLDYHGKMAVYWDCKRRFFTEMLAENAGTAVINCDDPRGAALFEALPIAKISAGAGDCQVRAIHPKFDISGITGSLKTPAGTFDFTSGAVGRHNLENILGAVGAGYGMGLSASAMVQGIREFNVPGRLERVEGAPGISLFVDYAHTPDALERVLSAVRRFTPGRTITVFGCGGDRDRAKRPLMGKIAEKASDFAVVTSDNPRTEDPQRIIDDILEGMTDRRISADAAVSGIETSGIVVEPDRMAAIRLAVKIARPGDTVMIAGKGHETYQIIGQETLPFDDRMAARRAYDE